MRAFETPDTGQVEQLVVDGVALAVRSWGDMAGRPVLFWHPLGDVTSGAYLTETAPMLAGHGIHLVAPDAPGFGASPALPSEDYAVARLAALVWGLAAALGLERPALIGHSWGGIVMLAAAAQRPRDVSAMVLLDSGQFEYADRPGAHPEWSLDERVAAIAEDAPTYRDRADLLRQVQEAARRPLTEDYAAGLAASMRTTQDGFLDPVATPLVRASAQHAMLRERTLPHWDALADAAVPTLLLLATEPEPVRASNEVGARLVEARHPAAEIRSLPGWGHDLLADGGPALAGIIGTWLTSGAGKVSPPHP